MRMQSRARDVVIAGIVLTVAMSSGGAARAQSTITIAMTAAPAAPRLQGPLTFAARAATPLVFSIPATGQTPLTFSATGLPAGLAIAAATGIISGTMPAAGSYPVAVTVSNAAGSASATPADNAARRANFAIFMGLLLGVGVCRSKMPIVRGFCCPPPGASSARWRRLPG